MNSPNERQLLVSFKSIPKPILNSRSLVRWQFTTNSAGMVRKTPVNSRGYRVGYDSSEALITNEDTNALLNGDFQFGLGVSLQRGLELRNDSRCGFLWCFDFDGFVSLKGDKIEDGVSEFLTAFPSYAEVSPSGTGFKYFCLSDLEPRPKFKVQFGRSEFADQFPSCRKYLHREVEIFSMKIFLALTGDILTPDTQQLNYFDSKELGSLIAHLNSWSGKANSHLITHDQEICVRNTEYSKLSPTSLEEVLGKVDNFEEQVWSDVANILARVYEEEGRSYFQRFSAGEYNDRPYPQYDRAECDSRFTRALDELPSRPDGYGIKHLLELAGGDSKLLEAHVEFEQNTSLQREINTSVEEISLPEHPDSTPNNYAFRLYKPNEVLNLPQTEWLIKNLVPKGGVCSIYGPSGSGKSFLVLEMAGALCRGVPFFNRPACRCPVTYVVLEGENGFRNRLQAYESHYDIKLPPLLRIVLQPMNLSDSVAAKFSRQLVAEDMGGGVVIIDTLSRATPGMDENSSVDMSKLLSAVDIIQRQSDATVILIHHTGKDATRGARGHSSLFAALDLAIEVRQPKTGREWRIAKSKDGEDGRTYPFDLGVVSIGIDEDGVPITSCVALDTASRDTFKSPLMGKNQKQVLDFLTDCPSSLKARSFDVLVDNSLAALQSPNRRARVQEAIQALIDRGYVEQRGDEFVLK